MTQRILYVAGFILLAVGLAFLAISFNVGHNLAQFVETAITAEGTISSIVIERDIYDAKNNYYAKARFSANDGSEYEFRLQYYNSAMRVGDAVTVYYPPGKPREARVITGYNTITVTLTGIGIFFAIPGICAASLAESSRFRKKRVRELGREVSAVITDIIRKRNIYGKERYLIKCRYKSNEREFLFTSEPVSKETVKGYAVGGRISVFIDPCRPAWHVVVAG